MLETTDITLDFNCAFQKNGLIFSDNDSVDIQKTSDLAIDEFSISRNGYDVTFETTLNKDVNPSYLDISIRDIDADNNITTYSSEDYSGKIATKEVTLSLSEGTHNVEVNAVETLPSGETTSDTSSDSFVVNKYDLTFDVKDTSDNVINGAYVGIEGNYTTDNKFTSDGTTTFSDLLSDTYSCIISDSGYSPEYTDIILSADTTDTVTLTSNTSPIGIDTFTVSRTPGTYNYIFSVGLNRSTLLSNLTIKTIEFDSSTINMSAGFNGNGFVFTTDLEGIITEGSTEFIATIQETLTSPPQTTSDSKVTSNTLNLYDVTFNISDSSGALSDATVVFNSQSSDTDASGQTYFNDNLPNTYSYSVSKTGYTAQQGNINIIDSNISSDITLSEYSSTSFPIYYGSFGIPIYYNGNTPSGTQGVDYYKVSDITSDLVLSELTGYNPPDIDYFGMNFNIVEGYPVLVLSDSVTSYEQSKKDNNAWILAYTTLGFFTSIVFASSSEITIDGIQYGFLFFKPTVPYPNVTVTNGYIHRKEVTPQSPPTGFPTSDFQ